MSLKDLEKRALDKKAWRDMVADLCLHGATGGRRRLPLHFNIFSRKLMQSHVRAI
jgi:hypothetical protein